MAVVRSDVVQIGFDVKNGDALDNLAKGLRDFQNNLTKMDVDAPLNKATTSANKLKSALSNLSASNITSGISSDIETFNARVSIAKDKFNQFKSSLKSVVTHPIKTLDKQLLTVQMSTGRVISNVKRLSAEKLTNLKSGLTNIKDALTGGEKGFKGFLTAAKNLAKIGFEKTASGISKLYSNLKSLAGSALSKATSGLQKLAKISLEALKKGLVKIGDKLKDIVKQAGAAAKKLASMTVKGLSIGIGAATAGMAALGTQAVKGYADFEQLKGGVETLFGARGATSVEEYAKLVGKSVDSVKGEYDTLMASQQKVLDNANNAWKNSGLSANAYIETVTSFSASLLQSLDGDTTKAASVADRAIQDMSDNANKMGTDISTIQTAYQGFAKQNYTMLDNLKLGYGGTKEEMQRLIEDANKLKVAQGGVADLSIESYADIVEAIGLVQDEMGITGTTAKEAEKTLTGSANAMKAAWSNFLVGMADENADFDGLLNNLLTSVDTFFNGNLLPRIKTMLPRLVQGITQLAQNLVPQIPGILYSLLPALLDGATNLMDTLINTIQTEGQKFAKMASEIGTKFVTFLLQSIPQLIVAGMEMFVSFVQGIAQQIPTLVPTAIQAINTLIDGFIQNLPLLIEAGLSIIKGLSDGLLGNIGTIVSAAVDLLLGLVNGLIQNLDLLVQSAISIVNALVEGLIANLPQIILAALDLVMALCNSLLNNLDLLISAALGLINALCQGLLANLGLILQAAVQLVMGLLQGIINNLNLILVGAIQLIFALVNGLLSNIGVIIQAAFQLVFGLVSGLIANIGLIVNAAIQMIGEFIKGLFSVNWLQVGWDILKAIASGIWNGIKSLGKGLWEGIKGIFSGSDTNTEANTSGQQTMTSYSSGLTTGSAGVTTATSSISSTLTTGLTNDLTGAGSSTMGTYGTGLQSGVAGVTGVTDGLGNTVSTGMDLDLNTQGLGTMNTYNSGITSGSSTVDGTTKDTATGIKSTFDNLDLTSSGINIMQGLVSGMNSMKSTVMATAEAIAASAAQAINSALQINSPSRVTQYSGEMTGEGYIQGMEGMRKNVANAASSLYGSMYRPTQTPTSNTSVSSTNNYNPSFTLNMSGTVDRTTERTIKQWVQEALEDVFDSMSRTNPRVTEV